MNAAEKLADARARVKALGITEEEMKAKHAAHMAAMSEETRGKYFFGQAYMQFHHLRKAHNEAQKRDIAQMRKTGRIPLELTEDDMELTARVANLAGFGGLTLGAGLMGGYELFRRKFRPAQPRSKGLMAGLAAAGLLVGTAATSAAILFKEAARREELPIQVDAKTCYLYEPFKACAESNECLLFTITEWPAQRMVNAYLECLDNQEAFKLQNKLEDAVEDLTNTFQDMTDEERKEAIIALQEETLNFEPHADDDD